ncbi:MAG: tRNA (guanosine(37)-N1)-methyltransferase TrmD [Lentisphaeria bacterium]|nr:tRNA (guanosine(37)-N1)-methyltransferase TrmD [Lentisphaeria bacterium]
MRIDVVSLFPGMFQGPISESIIKRAQDQSHVEIGLTNPRDFTEDKRSTVDDRPYGGGAGMVLKAEPLVRAVESVVTPNAHTILLTPQGAPFSQQKAQELAHKEHLVFVCGHYEGVDDRVCQTVIDEEISIGDYVLTNGSLAAMIIMDAVIRLIPGVLGCQDSAVDESFSYGLLEYPQFTRPEEFRGLKVPDVLLSGNHQEIAKWRFEQSLMRTKERRKDLYDKHLNTGSKDHEPRD